jgi:hypothetical protein
VSVVGRSLGAVWSGRPVIGSVCSSSVSVSEDSDPKSIGSSDGGVMSRIILTIINNNNYKEGVPC